MLRAMKVVVLGGLLAALGMVPFVRAQDRSKLDQVEYFDKAAKKNVEVYGKIEDEGPGGIKMKVKDGKAEKTITIAPATIVSVYYSTPDLTRPEYRKGFVKENKWLEADPMGKNKPKYLAEAVSEYNALLDRLRGRNEARRYIQYKLTMLAVAQAKDDPGKLADALKQLKDFTSSNRGGWQILPALTTQAKLLEEAGKPDEAREAYEEITKLPDVPPALVRQSEVLVGKLLLRAGKHADAEKRLAKLLSGLSGADEEKPFVQAYLAESKIGQGTLEGVEASLNEVIKGSADGKLRAIAHNLLGDFHAKKGQQEDAFWHYLRVDALYNEDPEEQAKALFHLATLFDKVKRDPVRARDCVRKLLSNSFDNTRFQKTGKAAGMTLEEM